MRTSSTFFERVHLASLWKLESDTMKNKPENFSAQKGIPQADLFSPPKVELFIT